MKNNFSNFVVLSSKIDRQKIQLVLAILALVVLVLGIGAPVDGGGITHGH
jgi:hypothetical protein